ncbi:MAG: hypothetical protein M1840_006972, partial [Geoglossum simile]
MATAAEAPTPVADVGLTFLSNPQNAVADIVFVHGLQGHPQNTWTYKSKLAQSPQRRGHRTRILSIFHKFSKREHPEPGISEEVDIDQEDGTEERRGQGKDVFWPRDLLKKDFPIARIMTFGYNTNITQGYEAANQGNIFSHARDLLYGLEAKRRQSPNRDLVFIVHSLGGILVKEVLRRSEADPDQKIAKIFRSTTGVFFFGTPHRGSKDWASFGEGVAAVAGRILGVDVNTQVIHALLPSGPELEICRESFTAQWVKRGDSLTVRTFQESKGVTGTRWGGFNKLIVPPDSSTLDHPGQRARTIDADHIEMVKFSGKNDKAYEMVKEDIEDLVTRAGVVHNFVSDQPKEQKDVQWSENECKCQQLLRTSDYESYKDRNPDRVERTCQWFLKHPNFQTWHQSNTSSLLWVSADPGCGKSVLSKSLVEKELKSTESRTTCYFFFKDDDVKQKSATNALSALLHQLFSQRKFLIQHAIPAYGNEGHQLPTLFHKLWAILTEAATDPKAGEVICILDALDECEESGRYNIIKALNAFYKKVNSAEGNLSRFKFLATSRPYLDIERRFTELTHDMPTVHLQGEKESKAISEEINLVIHFEVYKNVGLELNLNDSERSFLERRLSSMPHRTYLWLKLILEVIRSRTSVTQMRIKEIVSNLPTTVETAYEAILEKSSDKTLARKLLCIIVAAVRPLTLNEMNIALAIEDHHRSSKDLDLEDEIRFEGTVRHLCGLFVSVVDQKIYLIHQTAKEFLLAKPEMCSGVWKHSIEPVVSELIVAKTCITYLLFAEFSGDLDIEGRSQDERESKVEHHTDKHHYLGYAASQWAIHYQKAQARAEHGMLQSILDICDTQSQRFWNWFYVYWTLVHRYNSTPGFISSITVVSYFGHEAVVERLLATGKVDVNSKDDEYGQTPLSWAARGGHEAVVKLLLATGKVDVDSKDNEYGQTPLSWAARGGHEAVVKLLLATGKVDVDSKDNWYGQTPLSWAARGGHEAVVKLLLATGKVDVDSKGNEYGQTPLSWAAEGGHEAVVKLLLATGKVDVDSKDNEYGQTPLSWAARGGHE